MSLEFSDAAPPAPRPRPPFAGERTVGRFAAVRVVTVDEGTPHETDPLLEEARVIREESRQVMEANGEALKGGVEERDLDDIGRRLSAISSKLEKLKDDFGITTPSIHHGWRRTVRGSRHGGRR